MTKPDPARLRTALDRNDKKELLSVWAGHPFFALFGQDPDGTERPVSVVFGNMLTIVMTLDEDKSQDLIAAVDAGPDVTTFIKAAPLSELARLAHSDGATLALTGESILFQPSSLVLLGYTALLENESGEPSYCRIKTFPLEGDAGEELAPGCIQQWSFTGGSKSDGKPRLIVDDALDWKNNPRLLKLPGNATPASALSPRERTIFDQRARPSLTETSPPAKLVEDGSEPAPTADVPEEYLAGPRQVYTLLQEFLFPVARRLKLDVRDTADNSIKFEIQYMDEADTASGARITPVSFYQESLTSDECRELPFLPIEPGIHPVPGALKGLLKRYLAWGLFAESRHLEGSFNLFGGQLRNLLSVLPDNSSALFFCNPEDSRFPYLARFRCAGQGIPVLVLGMQGDDYVCNPLKCAEFDESQVPADIPAREDLVSNGTMNLWELSGAVVLPAGRLDCPSHWYTGIRLSARYMLSDARKAIAMLSRALQEDTAA